MARSAREGIPQTLRKLGIKSWGVTILDQCEMAVRSQSRDKKDRTHAENLPAQVAKPQRFGACDSQNPYALRNLLSEGK